MFQRGDCLLRAVLLYHAKHDEEHHDCEDSHGVIRASECCCEDPSDHEDPNRDIEIPLGNVVVSLILLILPVVIGMAMRRWTANVDGALEVLGSVLGMVFILLLLVTWVPGNWPLLIATPWQVYVGAIALP